MDEWSPTMMLQFVSRSGQRVLQQLFQRFHTNEHGHISSWDEEWREVALGTQKDEGE